MNRERELGTAAAAKEGEASAPSLFCCSLGGYFGPSFRVELIGASQNSSTLRYFFNPDSCIGERVVRVSQIRFPEPEPLEDTGRTAESQMLELEVPTERWQAFRKVLDDINIWRWKREYSCPMCDGTIWEVRIAWGKRRLKSGGLNSYPPDGRPDVDPGGEFEGFCKAVERLLGGLKFE